MFVGPPASLAVMADPRGGGHGLERVGLEAEARDEPLDCSRDSREPV